MQHEKHWHEVRINRSGYLRKAPTVAFFSHWSQAEKFFNDLERVLHHPFSAEIISHTVSGSRHSKKYHTNLPF